MGQHRQRGGQWRPFTVGHQQHDAAAAMSSSRQLAPIASIGLGGLFGGAWPSAGGGCMDLASSSSSPDKQTPLQHEDKGKALGSSPLQPLMELAMAKDEIKARLAPIPVFTVANPKNEFVLVAGENNAQLGFFFFKREDAEAIVQKIKEENPRLAKDSKILRVTMDNVYEVFTTPRDVTGLQEINFRFMPDMKQVQHALQIYSEAGVPTRQFIGVPVFQAEGLTVTAQETNYVPLFLCKEDLDVAVQSAFIQRNAAQIKIHKDKADKFLDEYNQVQVQANSATGGREKQSLENKAAKAKQRAEVASLKLQSVEKAPMPKIEVGSFEEVMTRMTASTGDDLASWSQVMFVAPGLLCQQEKK